MAKQVLSNLYLDSTLIDSDGNVLNRDLPLDTRLVVQSEGDILKSTLPYVGMLVFVKDTASYFVVTELGSKVDRRGNEVAGSKDTTVKSYQPLSEFLKMSGGELGTSGGGKEVPDYDF